MIEMTETDSPPGEIDAPRAPGLALRGLDAARGATGKPGPAPVHLWNPPFCGNLDLRISADGTWVYQGSPIGRTALVTLFARVLRRDADGKFYLVTPVEKIGIEVEDAPFLAVAMAVSGSGPEQAIDFSTNVGDSVAVGAGHPLRFTAQPRTGGLKPYVLVRDRLEALVARAVLYDLVDLGVEHTIAGKNHFGVWSRGEFFPMAPADSMAPVDVVAGEAQ